MRKKQLANIFIILIIFIVFASCASFSIEGAFGSPNDSDKLENDVDCKINCPANKRNGGVCKDGTVVKGNGKGQCNKHGGVKCWYCED